MAVSDALMGHLTTTYVGAIAAIKAYALVTGRSFTGLFVLVASRALVVAALIGALTWDVHHKVAAHSISGGDRVREMCRGPICWHSVAVKAPASQFRFRLLQHQPMQD